MNAQDVKRDAQKILAVETCTNICSVALWDGERMHEDVVEAARSHSKQILPMCEKVLHAADMTMQDVDGIACTRGPGSFTGLRIGVGVAKGLAFGQDLPIYAVSSLQTLAYRVMQQTGAEQVIALLDARMGELYCGHYENQNGFPHLVGDECLTDIEHLSVQQQVIAGTGAVEYVEALSAKGITPADILYPMASDIIALVQAGDIEAVSASALAPVYLRNKVTY